MTFETTKFTKQKFQQRTEEVSVPALEPWFSDKDESRDENGVPVWIVGSLTSHQIAKLREITTTAKNLKDVIDAIGSSDKARVQELKKVMGLSDDTPNDLRTRLEQLVMGSVEPKIDSALAVRLAEAFPTTFYTLTDTITKLTAMGMDVKK